MLEDIKKEFSKSKFFTGVTINSKGGVSAIGMGSLSVKELAYVICAIDTIKSDLMTRFKDGLRENDI